MGVKLLQSFLKKHADCLVNTINVSPRENHNNNHPGPCEANAPPQFIIVDAHGFLISLSEEVHTLFDAWSASNHRDVFPDADLVGGDLQAVRSALAHLVKRLIAVYGVQLIFAVDAPRGMRSDTCERDAVWDQRARENQDALVQRMEYCKGKTPFKNTKRNSRRTTPFMLSSQLFATLRAMCVPILQLDDEVDGYIGALVHELQPLCVFTGDTDFIVTDGIPVVMEFDLPWDAMLFGWEYHKGSGSVSAATTAVVAQPDLALPTIQAASLVSYLDLSSPDELYLAASLCGNDITSHHLVALRSASAIPPASSSHHQRHNGVYTITDAAKDVVQHYRGNDGQYSVETLPDVIQLSIDRYREAARRIAYTPSLDPTLLAILDKVVAEQLPVHFVGLIRSGFCMDGPTPLLDGNFGYVHDLFTFKRLRHAVAHILGRTSFNVYERGEQRSVAKIIAKKINSNSNDDDKTTDGAKSTKVEDDSVSAPATIELLREVKVELPREVISALPPVWNSVEDQQLNRTTRDPVEKILALGPLLTMFPGQGLSLLSSATQQDAQGKSIPQSITLILWALHSACTCSKEVQRILEMMVLIHTSERGNPTQQAVARNILQGLPKVKAAAVSTAAKKRGDAADEDNRPLDVFRKRPSVRTLELAHLFASAYDSTRSLVKVLRLHDDIAFPEPADVFSGTLLHVLDSNSPLTANTLKEAWKSGTTGDVHGSGSGEVDQVVNDIIASVERLSSTFHTMFETIQYRKPQGDGDDGVRIIHVDQVYQWAGILQQHEETIDTLETGGTSRTQMSIASSSAAAALQQSQLFAAKTPEEGNATSSSALPIDEHIPALLAAISANRVVCVQGDTGCGKSSMIPLQLYLDAVKRGQRVQIVVTQPRRLAAVALAQRVSSLLGEEVGTTVGYRLGGNAREESSATRIFFVTAGYLLESLVHGSNLWSRTTHLLLDEVHERSLDADMLSLVIRLMLQHDDDVEASSRRQHAKRLVVMSATIQAELFMNYFMPLQWRTGGGSSSPESPTTTGAVTAHDTMEMPLLHVGGRHMQVEEMYLPDVITLLQASHVPQDVLADLLQYQKRVDRAVSRAAFAISAQDIRALCSLMMACVKPATCILVFLPGLKEIEDCFEELTNRRTRSPVNLRVHALHSIVDGDDQARVLIPADDSECKIVLSTNIAETSITIPDVKVVIDLGFARRVVYDEAKRLQCIQCVWCSRAAAKQRAGRAGRVTNGLVLRLYTQNTMTNIMPDFEESDCFPLEASVLKVRQHLGQYGDVEGLMQQLVEPPTTTMVAEALARLVEWGALGPAPNYDILELGEVATMLPIDVSLTKSVLLASRFGCAADMLVIAAGLTLQRSPYRLPMRAFFQSDYEFQENVMLALRSIHHFDQQRCNDLFQYIAILEEALAAGGRLGDFCTRWYLSFRQVQSLLRTTKLLCKRLLTAEQAGKMRFTDADRATMRRLSGEQHHGSSSALRFQSLVHEGCSELLQLALAQDAERMVSASVESLTNSLQRLLDNAKTPDGRPPAWLISPESFHSDVVFFSGVDKTVAGAGSKALADHLKLFDVKDSLVFPVGHGTYGAVVRVPHEKETAERSVPAGGQPHPLSVAARTDAICRMGRLYRSSHWSFCASKEGDMSSSMSLPKAQTTAVVKRWKAVELPSKSMNTAESDDDDDYERDEDDDSTAPYSSDSSASLPAKTSNRAKKGAAKGKQQKKKKKLTAVVTNLQLDRWSAVGSTSTVVLGAGVKSIPAFGFAFNLMSTQASMLLASTVLMINAKGGFPLLALLASRRSTQLPPVLQVSVLKPDPFSDNDAPLVKHIATNIPSYDLILESAAAAQSNNSTICATTFLELNLIRMLLCTGVAASPHGDNKQASRASNKHHGCLSHSREEQQVLPTAEAILRTISDIRSLRSSNANNGARQFVISSGAPPSKSKWETMWLRVARLEAHPQLALYDIASLVEGSGVFSATTTSNAAAAAPPRTAWQRAIHAYTTCVANTAVSITALAGQHQKKQSLHMKRQTSNEAPQSVAAPPQAVAAKGSQKQRSVVASPAPSAATQSSTAASSPAAAGFVSRILATSVMLEIPFTSATIQKVLSAAVPQAHKKEMRQWLLQHPNTWIAQLIDAKWIVVQQQSSSPNGSSKDLYVPGPTMRCTEFPSVKTAVQLITTSRESELYFSAPKSKKKTARFCMTLLPSPWPKICNDDATRSQVLKSDWMTKVLASLVNSAQWLVLIKSRYQLNNVPSAMVKAPQRITTEEKPSVDSGTVIGSDDDDSDSSASHVMSPPSPAEEIPPRQQLTINVAIEHPTVASTVQLVVASPRGAEYFSKARSARQAALFYISLLPDPWATLLSRDVRARNKFAVSPWTEGVRNELLSMSWLMRTSRGYMHAAAPVAAAAMAPAEESGSTADDAVSVANSNNNNNTVVTTQTTPAQTQPPSHPLPPPQHIITKILATKVTLEAPFTSSAVRDMLLTSSKLNAKNKKELRLWMTTDPSWLSHLVAANWVTPSGGEKKKNNSNNVDSGRFEPGPAMISTPFPTVDKTVQLVINSAQSVTYFEEPKSGRKAAMFCISLLPNPWASMCAKDVATRNLFATSRWIGDVLAELVKSQWLVLAKDGYRHRKAVVSAPATALASAMIPTPVFSFDDSVPVLPAFHFGNTTVPSDSLVSEEIARPKDQHFQLRQRITTILLNAKCPLAPPFIEHNDSLVNWISTTIVSALGKQAPPELLLANDKKSQWLSEAAVMDALVDVEWLVCLPTQTASSESSPRMFSAGKRMKQLPTPTVTEMVQHLNVHKGAIHDEVGTLSYFHTPRSKADTARFLIKHLPQPWAQLPATTKAVWQNSAWMATVIAELVKLEWLSQLEDSYTTQ